MESNLDKFKEFRPTSWAIDNRVTIFVATVIISLMGIFTYNNLPKEKFPDIVIPTIYVATVYPGSSPKDMEKITKEIEEEVKSISGVKKFKSTSIQDFSSIVVEFKTDVDVSIAKRKVEDAVARARPDLPNDLPREPMIVEADFSEMPIMFVNLAGDFDLIQLKKFADLTKEKIRGVKEITRVDIVGALEREVQINVDMNRMQAAKVTLGDIERAVGYENLNIAGGTIGENGMKKSISVKGEIKSVEEISNLVVSSMSGSTVNLHDIAAVTDTFKEQESFARLDHKKVVTLNIIKRSGENLINASDKVRAIVEEMKKNDYPKELSVSITGDQSFQTRVTLHDLINTIIIGFILVTFILMFFMGVTNALFVAMSVPLSMFLAFLVMPMIGFSLNMIVLFSLLLALGIVVDDAIVVIENTHRIFKNGKVPIVTAAKMAAGEVFLPVLSGTLTTMAPFFPLTFWTGIIGKFMFFLPITLIITLFASLFVAYIINPVFAAQFMKPHTHERKSTKKQRRGTLLVVLGFAGIILLSYAGGNIGFGNFALFILFFYFLTRFVLNRAISTFQDRIWPAVQERYKKILGWALRGKRPILVIVGTFFLFIFSIMFFASRSPGVRFFPEGDPNFIYTYLNLPAGTDQLKTDSITKIVEERIFKVIGENFPGGKNPIVESVISNVAVGATDPMEGDRSVSPNKGKVSVAFVEFARRNGISTRTYLDKIRNAVQGIPGVQIIVEQEKAGPPTSKPVNIEISGANQEEIVKYSGLLKHYLDSINVSGVEELKSDMMNDRPEILVQIDKRRAESEGISTGQIGGDLRTMIFGKEISKLRDDEDDYPIQLRFRADQRTDVENILNHRISFRDMKMFGMFREIPISAVATVKDTFTAGGIRRINNNRVITLGSNLLSGFTPDEVVPEVQRAIDDFPHPSTIKIKMTGEQEEQMETAAFLGNALMFSMMIIFLILVMQFNSVGKTMIILSEIFFSIIGVLLGFGITRMEMSIVMVGVGIIALAGIVVRNGILLVEFTDQLRKDGYPLKDAIIEAGKTRMTPVLLTAFATMLGLIPLAVGLNIDFGTLFSELDPNIFLGGDSVVFWGPLAWTMIFGLLFATLITLILVPVMYLLNDMFSRRMKRFGRWITAADDEETATETVEAESIKH